VSRPARTAPVPARPETWIRTGVALGGLLLLGVGLVDLPRFLPNPDEGIDYRIAYFAGPAEARAAIRGNAHPPLYYGLLRAIAALAPGLGFPADVVALRLPSLLAAVAAVWALYAAGARAFEPATGALAAGLLGTSPLLREQAELVRPYAVLVALLAAGLWALAVLLRTGDRRAAAGLGMAFALAVGIHYSAGILLAALVASLAVAVVASPAERAAARRALVALLPALAGAAWLFATHIRPRLEGSAIQTEARTGWLAAFFPELAALPLAVGCVFVGLAGLAAGAVAVLLALGVARAARGGRLVLGLLPVLALALAAGLGLAGRYPVGASRHALYLLPPIALLAAHGAVASWRAGRSGRTALAVGAVVAALASVALAARLSSVDAPPVFRPVEQVTEWAAHPEIAAQLSELRGSEGFVLMPRTSFLTLLPVLRPHVRDFRRDGERRLFHLRWGERRVFVHEGWELHLGGGPGSLAGLIARAAESDAGAGLRDARELALLVSGWSQEVVAELAAADAALPPALRRVRAAVQAPGYSGLILARRGPAPP